MYLRVNTFVQFKLIIESNIIILQSDYQENNLVSIKQ